LTLYIAFSISTHIYFLAKFPNTPQSGPRQQLSSCCWEHETAHAPRLKMQFPTLPLSEVMAVSLAGPVSVESGLFLNF